MKIKIQLKSPDCLFHPCKQAAEQWVEKHYVPAVETRRICHDIDEDKELAISKKQIEFEELCSNWFKYQECLTIEVDTVNKTISVLPAE